MSRPAKRAITQPHSLSDLITMTKGRRIDSPNWEAIITLPNGKKITRSTGKTDLRQAEEAAFRQMLQLYDAVSNGRGVGVRKFSEAADLCVANLRARFEASGLKGTAAHKFLRPMNIIKNSLTPTLGELPISGISENDFRAYVASLKGRKSGVASAGTVKNHNHALQMVFEAAADKGWIGKGDRHPLIATNVNAKPDPRPPFSHAEILQLVEATNESWIESGPTGKSKEIRAILREFIIICASTGLRPGTEAYNLSWDRVNEAKQLPEGQHVVFQVSRHTGKRHSGREVVGYEKTGLLRPSLKRLRMLTGNQAFIFARPSDGKTPKEFDIHGAFEKLLADTGLTFDADNDKRSLYSLRHYYAVQMHVHEKRSWEELSKQMGTSPEMLDEFYSSRVTALDHATGLSGVPASKFGWLDPEIAKKPLVFDPKSGSLRRS